MQRWRSITCCGEAHATEQAFLQIFSLRVNNKKCFAIKLELLLLFLFYALYTPRPTIFMLHHSGICVMPCNPSAIVAKHFERKTWHVQIELQPLSSHTETQLFSRLDLISWLDINVVCLRRVEKRKPIKRTCDHWYDLRHDHVRGVISARSTSIVRTVGR